MGITYQCHVTHSMYKKSVISRYEYTLNDNRKCL